MAIVVVTAPAVEPVTLNDLKQHVRATDFTDDDEILTAKGISARQHVERFIGKPLISTTFELVYDAFPAGEITLPKGPLQSVTSVKYLDATTGLEATMPSDDYAVDTASDPGRIKPGVSGWPDTADTVNAVRIRFVAGYGDAPSDVPEPLREAVLQLAAQLYQHRAAALVGESAASIPFGVGDMLGEYREWSF
ncbi:hypothetical protein [Aquibium sp. ELW1220]|uniref:head-tail connector protein n=1 Tax=Aquibium sp. ELW1220 TaxID=2976766 RepID=UPI0025B12545|nr:hypothetical protein [Aquibium sp. ELW1220]MDN2580241.1 hypothetical protein [Aquibium sp. ELW1220]